MTLSRIPSSKRGVRSYSQALNCPSRRGARLRDRPQRCHRRSAAPSPQYSYAYITGLPPPPRSAAGLYDKLLRSAIISYASIVLALALPKLFLASQAQLKQVQSCRSERDREDHGAPDFGRLVNPISHPGDRLCPSHEYFYLNHKLSPFTTSNTETSIITSNVHQINLRHVSHHLERLE